MLDTELVDGIVEWATSDRMRWLMDCPIHGINTEWCDDCGERPS